MLDLWALADEFRRLRQETGLSQARLAWLAALSEATPARIESARRRSRRSTLNLLVGAMVDASPGLGMADELVDRLCALAGPALAPEAEADIAAQIARRRARRLRKRANKEAWAKRAADQLAAMPRPEGRAAVKAARSGDLDTVNAMLDRLEARR
jgi:transcriptional regulator with XRE-family HTH domain